MRCAVGPNVSFDAQELRRRTGKRLNQANQPPREENMTMSPTRRTAVLLLAALALSAGSLAAQGGASDSASDSSDVAAIVRRFDALMAAGDSTGLLALLADDAVILESGGLETRAEFRSHHLPADIAFARAVTGRQGPILVRVQGDVAWASSTSTVEGELRGRVINSVSAELMVFSRVNGGWRIRAIHWSSRNRRPPGGP